MRISKIIGAIILTLCFASQANAQFGQVIQDSVIQFSGKVVTEDEQGDVVALPYVNVAVEGTNRGATSEYDGYFSFVAKQGEKVVFSRIGYNTVTYTIPDTLSKDFYSWIQIMSQDTILLDEVIILPWPSREHFKHELLAIDISDDLREQAEKNLANNVMTRMRHTVPVDGQEASTIVLKEKAEAFKYSGQIKPQRIFDVFAWKKFIEAWKRGDYKRKKKKT